MNEQQMATHDFSVYAESLAIVTPVNERAKAWLAEGTEGDLHQRGEGVTVELRYVRDLCAGILDAGFTIQKDGMSMVRDEDGDLVLEAAK